LDCLRRARREEARWRADLYVSGPRGPCCCWRQGHRKISSSYLSVTENLIVEVCHLAQAGTLGPLTYRSALQRASSLRVFIPSPRFILSLLQKP